MAIDQARIQKAISKLGKFAATVPKDPSPEEVHELRTNARKLEAIFGALSLDTKSSERRLLKRVRKIRRRAGRVRDLDVLTEHLAGLELEGETKCRKRLAKHLAGERRRQARKLHDKVSRQCPDLDSRLQKASRQVKRFLKKNEPEPSSLAAAHALELSAQLEDPKRLNRENLHPFRLKVKQLRDVLQLAPGPDSRLVDDLSEVKDAIGEWHDWEELVIVADEVLNHSSGCKLRQKLREIRDEKYRDAAGVAEGLRKKYAERPAKKPSRSVRISPAALSSAAALAAGYHDHDT
ncbi:MAG: CHAD domain-containing protein [Acidobacteria bacterium]|nr:CHAD domain-containing protein [Acidobacteriota bacterium]